LPLTSLADDVAAVGRTIARIDAPVVLVGHAYAGAVIGETRCEKIKALVYVAALPPDESETVADVFYRGEPHPKAPKLGPDEDALIWLKQEAFAEAFAQNGARGNARGAGGGPASDCHSLHHCSCRGTLVAEPAELISAGRRRSHDRR
jgi:pimeloyl-ACP methyl ester carboxylesterase